MKVTYTCEFCGCPCFFIQHFRQMGEPGIPKFCPLDGNSVVEGGFIPKWRQVKK